MTYLSLNINLSNFYCHKQISTQIKQMFIVNGKTDPPHNNKWVLGGCETVCKSGCFDRVTLSDDDGRCNHSFSTARAGAGRASGGVEPGGPTPVRCTPATGRPSVQIGPPLLSERPKERVPPAACRSRRQSFECVRQPAHSTAGSPAPPFGPGHQFIS